MAKIGLSKLGLTKNIEIKTFNWNDQKIEVKQYLPMQNKLNLCSEIINESVDDQSFYNPGRVAVYQVIEIILAYTNINVTEKQKEDPCKLYDLFANGLLKEVYSRIPEAELGTITNIVEATIENIYKYKNSVMGILDTISADYNNLDLDAQKIQKELADKDNMSFLRDVMTKLG